MAGARAVRVGAAVLSAATLVVTTGAAVGWSAIKRVEGRIGVDAGLGDQLATPDGSSAVDPGTGYRAENILIVGSDTRTGQGSGFGDAATTASGNGHSDTTLLLHISADRTRAFAVSIPRDSWVQRPGCTANGKVDGMAAPGKFNTAYAVGGRRCVIAAVTYLTGVPIDHFVEVSFLGFEKIVDALGGVRICAARDLSDPVRQDAAGNWHGSGLELSKGEHTLNGKQALEFVRSRSLTADADLGRIHRQQQFLSSIIRTASSTGLLTDPARLLGVLDAVAGSLTVDAGLSGDALDEFLLSLAGMRPAQIAFYSVPNEPRGDGENVVWKTREADQMWTAMKDDTPYPPTNGSASGGTGTGGGTPVADQPVLTVAPDQVSVRVVDASGSGLGAKAARQLDRAGFLVTSTGRTARVSPVTTMTYDPGWDVSAATLEWSADATASPVAGQGRTMVLRVGSGWQGLRRATITDPSTKPQLASDATCVS